VGPDFVTPIPRPIISLGFTCNCGSSIFVPWPKLSANQMARAKAAARSTYPTVKVADPNTHPRR
jgi:hypothetical protein